MVCLHWPARQAISELEKMVARHDDDTLLLAVNPMYDSLHSDQRYLALLRRVGLPLPEAGAVSQ